MFTEETAYNIARQNTVVCIFGFCTIFSFAPAAELCCGPESSRFVSQNYQHQAK